MATNKQVNASIKRILNKCGEVLISKGDEYSGEDIDRLANFKEACNIKYKTSVYNKPTQKKVLWGYLLKHLTSIQAMCCMVGKPPTREQWDEKIGDAINYLLLLSAMVDEEIALEAEPRKSSSHAAVTRHKDGIKDMYIREETKPDAQN